MKYIKIQNILYYYKIYNNSQYIKNKRLYVSSISTSLRADPYSDMKSLAGTRLWILLPEFSASSTLLINDVVFADLACGVELVGSHFGDCEL